MRPSPEDECDSTGHGPHEDVGAMRDDPETHVLRCKHCGTCVSLDKDAASRLLEEEEGIAHDDGDEPSVTLSRRLVAHVSDTYQREGFNRAAAKHEATVRALMPEGPEGERYNKLDR